MQVYQGKKQLEDDNKKLQELTGKDKLNSGYTEIPATVVSRNQINGTI